MGEAIETRAKWGDWIGFILTAILWLSWLVFWLLDAETFAAFLGSMLVYLVVMIVFAVWWLTRKQYSRSSRWLALAGALALFIATGFVTKSTIQPVFYLFVFGVPVLMTVCALWVLATSRSATRPNNVGLMVCLAIALSAFLLIRVDGTHGNMRADVHWRWTPTAEQMFLAQHTSNPIKTIAATQEAPIELQQGDWPGFRGPDRTGAAHGLKIDLDWQKSPPKVLWKQRVGPAWSSMAVVDGHVYTQEQRGEKEAVVCRDAANGNEIWVHTDQTRFEEPMAGPGPRATPTFSNGRLYTLGATGILNCLDAGSGKVIWTRDIGNDSGAKTPIWGFSSSPLVTDGKVIVFAGGENHKGLLAYPIDGGAPVWTADAGKIGYGSAQNFDEGDQHDALIFTAEGLYAVDRSSGALKWNFPIPTAVGVPPALQACAVQGDAILLGHGAGFGLERVQLTTSTHQASKSWATLKMKPSFSDMVYYDDCVYGFDGSVFCCMDARTGARHWREGRYGAGQVILLADQGAMIVTTEDGQAILLRCDPRQSQELGRVEAVSGKTWNHPAIAQNHLFVRSDGELACLELKRSEK